MQTASAMGDDRLQRLSQGYLLLLRATHALVDNQAQVGIGCELRKFQWAWF